MVCSNKSTRKIIENRKLMKINFRLEGKGLKKGNG